MITNYQQHMSHLTKSQILNWLLRCRIQMQQLVNYLLHSHWVSEKQHWMICIYIMSYNLRSFVARFHILTGSGTITGSGTNTILTLNAPIATKVVCFSRLLKCLRCLYGKQCGPRPVLGPRYLLLFVSNVRQLFAAATSADDIFRCIFFLAL